MSVGALPQNCQSVARPTDGRTCRRRDREVDMIADPSPLVGHLDFLNLSLAIHLRFGHRLGSGAKFFLAERMSAWSHEQHVIGHHIEYGRKVARLAGGHPSSDQFPYCELV